MHSGNIQWRKYGTKGVKGIKFEKLSCSSSAQSILGPQSEWRWFSEGNFGRVSDVHVQSQGVPLEMNGNKVIGPLREFQIMVSLRVKKNYDLKRLVNV